MIKYRLGCANGHAFEAWFNSIDAFETQRRTRLVACPDCGAHDVDRLPMAPAVIGGKRSSAGSSQHGTEAPGEDRGRDVHSAMAKLSEFRRSMLAKSENVGTKFADEARRIHFGEAEARTIHGQASLDDARGLADDGVAFRLLPRLPEDLN